MSTSSFDHLFFFYYSFSHYTAVFEYDSLRTRTYFRSLLLKKRLRVCCQPVVVVVFNVAGNLVIVVKFTLQSVFSNPHQNPRHASERSRRIHSSCILSFDLIGRHKNKRPNVTEIILLLGFADVTFLVERSEDRKNVCVRRLIWILPFQKRHLYNYFTDNRIVIFKVVRTLHYMV